MKCVVGMSGGVDSSVTAALAKQSGYEVFGCTFKMFDSEKTEAFIKDAQEVAKYLGVHHEVVDCRELFEKHVENYFIEMYANGKTPNPCVMCNDFVKFSVLDSVRQKHDADVLMTGHYAKLVHKNGRVELRQSTDPQKDQSYFLYRVSKGILQNTRFPLGEFHKSHTRELAQKFGLFVAEKSDSQDVCFIPSGDYKAFLNDKKSFSSGNIIDENGKILGKHNGIINYTIGQRKGLGLAGGPYYVKQLDPQKNSVIVSDKTHLGVDNIVLKEVRFINEEFVGKCYVKVRSASEKHPAAIVKSDGDYIVRFDCPEYGVAPGQHCVFYVDDMVVGGGII